MLKITVITTWVVITVLSGVTEIIEIPNNYFSNVNNWLNQTMVKDQSWKCLPGQDILWKGPSQKKYVKVDIFCSSGKVGMGMDIVFIATTNADIELFYR